MSNSPLIIGNLNLTNSYVMAPMAGITNLPFRMIMKMMGAGLVTSEMVSSAGLTLGDRKTRDYLKSHPYEKPLAVQIFGVKPELMAEAAIMVAESGADILDINMGCPAKKIIKTGAGGALMLAPEKAAAIVSAIRKVCALPLTVKIRSGWSSGDPSAVAFARIMEDCGADAITVHPRFVTQGFTGLADWNIIGEVKKHLKVPVIGNGDVQEPVQAIEMKRETGCDGIMIGRGATRNPWIFRHISDIEQGLDVRPPALTERKDMVITHFGYLAECIGEKRAAHKMRGLLLMYTRHLPGSRNFRKEFVSIKDFKTFVQALESYFFHLEGQPL